MSDTNTTSESFHFEPVELHCDVRGLVLEPADKETLCAQSNSHLVPTEPGCVRGNHYHREGAEVAVIVGPGLVRVREGSSIQDVNVPEGQAYRFHFPAGLPHAFQNTGDRTMVAIAFNTVIHDPSQPDVVRDILIEANA